MSTAPATATAPHAAVAAAAAARLAPIAAQRRGVGRRPGQQLREALRHEREQGNDGQAAEYRERHRLRLDGLLRFVLDDGQPADREDERELGTVR